MRRAWVEVDLGAVRRNAAALRRAAGVPLVAMVKADGYGVGAVAVARALVGAPDTIWALGVATLVEARALREAGIDARILCCTPLVPEELHDAKSLGIRPSLHRAQDIRAWNAMKGGAWHLAIDTGMSRAGIRWDTASSLRECLAEHTPEGVFTHFHSAEAPDGTRVSQDARFDEALRALRSVLPPTVLEHRDNSAGISSRLAAGKSSPGSLARPGIGLYGAFVADRFPLEQVVHLRARVIDVRTVLAGETVSYGGTYTATREQRIATLAVGHGDGYRRAFSNCGRVLLNGTHVPVAGVVSMDMTMIDVTDAPCEVGDVATLIGREGDECLTTDAVAASGSLSPYELLVGLALRAPRVFLEDAHGDR